MKVLIDICHPAHVHFFENPIQLLASNEHEVLITSRRKDVAVSLLDRLKLQHTVISNARGGAAIGLINELVVRNIELSRVVSGFRPDVMAAVGGIFVAQVGFIRRIPSIVFYDTENARLQNLLTYPFATRVVVPDAYEGWLPRCSRRYRGYHELSYLSPKYFSPSKNVAERNGLNPGCRNYLVRIVSWQANHDVGEHGWSVDLLRMIVGFLSEQGNLMISSESPLPDDLGVYAYQGDPASLHHVMAFCDLHVGESATMASESAMLGVPALYIANTSRGYINELDSRYGLVLRSPDLSFDSVNRALSSALNIDRASFQEAHRGMLREMVDVPTLVADAILETGRK